MATVLIEYDGGDEPGAGPAPPPARAFFQLIDGKLHLPTIREYFKLANVRLNNVVYPTDADGFSFSAFVPDDHISVTGDPMPGGQRAPLARHAPCRPYLQLGRHWAARPAALRPPTAGQLVSRPVTACRSGPSRACMRPVVCATMRRFLNSWRCSDTLEPFGATGACADWRAMPVARLHAVLDGRVVASLLVLCGAHVRAPSFDRRMGKGVHFLSRARSHSHLRMLASALRRACPFPRAHMVPTASSNTQPLQRATPHPCVCAQSRRTVVRQTRVQLVKLNEGYVVDDNGKRRATQVGAPSPTSRSARGVCRGETARLDGDYRSMVCVASAGFLVPACA